MGNEARKRWRPEIVSSVAEEAARMAARAALAVAEAA